MTDIQEDCVDIDGNPIPVRIEYEVPHERWDVFQQHPKTVRKVIEVVFSQDNDMVGRVDFEDCRDVSPWEPLIQMSIYSAFWGLLNTHSALFQRLSGCHTLADVKRLLDESGATDRTDRVDRTPVAPARRAISEWERTPSPDNAQAAGEALLALAARGVEPPF